MSFKDFVVFEANFVILKNKMLQKKNILKYIVIVGGVLIFLGLLPNLMPFYTVRYGQAGIVTRFGKIVRVSKPGFHLKIPIIENVEYYTTQKIIYETSENPQSSRADYTDYPVDTSTKDGQQIKIRYTIRFRINPEKVRWVAENIGKEEQVVERVVKADSRSVVRNIAREFTAQELYTGNVFRFQDRVEKILKKSFENNGLILDEFLTRQIKFSQEYVSAVEQKQIEKEKIKTEEYRAQQEEFRKQQRITRAEGEAKAQEILRRTIDPLVLQKMAIEKWDGRLPTYMGDNAVPFLNIR